MEAMVYPQTPSLKLEMEVEVEVAAVAAERGVPTWCQYTQMAGISPSLDGAAKSSTEGQLRDSGREHVREVRNEVSREIWKGRG